MTSDLGTASTKRYQAVDTGLTELPAFITSPEAGYVFVLEENEDGTYCIYAEGVEGGNYLGWTSGNSGALVAKSSAKTFTIKEGETAGTYNIYFDNTRYLSLNGTSGNNYFAFYTGTQKQDLTLIPVIEDFKVGVSLNIGSDLDLNVYATLPDGTNVDKMTFNGGEATLKDGKYTFTGITPDRLAEKVIITLKIKQGDYTYTITKDYSILDYCAAYAKKDDKNAEMMTLLANLMVYGKCTMLYNNASADVSAINAFITGEGAYAGFVTTYNFENEDGTKNYTEYTDYSNVTAGFAGATLVLNSKTDVRFELVNPNAIITAVKINGVELDSDPEQYEKIGNYIYVYDVRATEFDFEVRVEITVDGNDYVMCYSVNTYCAAMAYERTDENDEVVYTPEPEVTAICEAIYNYGKAAEAYAATKSN